MSLPSGTVTFLRSDIEGSMEHVRALGARYDELNAEHAALVRGCVGAEGGEVVRTEGDAFFVVFTDATAAARAAVAVQRAMAAHAWPEGHALRLRIGLHTGSAVRAGDDYGGFEVNRAARIAALGHGGQVIVSDAARALIAADLPADWSLRDLGRHRLKGVAEPEPIFQLEAAGLERDFEPLRSPADATAHLPTRMTSLIGREQELDELSVLLADTRLLTLTGPGGTGKTTLAIELARRHAHEYADGAWFIDLQAVRDVDASAVKGTIARGLGLFDGAVGTAADRLLTYVADRELLLVVDNFEQVIEAADEVRALLEASPRSRAVVTSRIPLRLSGEQEYTVRPLTRDADAEGEPTDAVRLFVDRVRRVRPDEPFEARELAIAASICHQLDGLPLAIELVAGRCGVLPLPLIEKRLRDDLPLPGAGPRDLPERQQTLAATVAWSYDLLDPDDRRLFARLGAFAGSFDLEQAEVVCAPDLRPGGVLDGLYRLVEQSLLFRIDADGGSVRFGMLETIRSFVRECLAASGEADATRVRHAEAYARVGLGAAEVIPGAEQARWIDRLEADMPELLSAGRYALSIADFRLAVRLVAVPWRLWLATGRLAQCRELVESLLKLPGAKEASPDRVMALSAAGAIAYWRGDFEEATRRYEEQAALAQVLGLRREEADAVMSLAFIESLSGDKRGARRAEANALYASIGDDESILYLDWMAAVIALDWDDPTTAVEMEAVASRLEATGNAWHEALAHAARSQAAALRGDKVATARLTAASFRAAIAIRDHAMATTGPQILVALAADHGRHDLAALLIGANDTVVSRFGVRPPASYERLAGRPDPGPRVEKALGAEVFHEAVRRGRRLDQQQMLDLMDEIVAVVIAGDRPTANGLTAP